jgi:dihydropteroate synthase
MPKSKICAKSLEEELRLMLTEKIHRLADVGIARNGPIIEIQIGFDPRILTSEFYREYNLATLRERIYDISHHSARLHCDIIDLERGVILVEINTIPDYCTHGRIKKAISFIYSMMDEYRKNH